MKKAAECFEAKLKVLFTPRESKNDPVKVLDGLNSLKVLILQKLRVCAFISVYDHRCAAVFDSLNSRGRSLSQLDLIKSFIYYKAMHVSTERGKHRIQRIHNKLQNVWHEIYVRARPRLQPSSAYLHCPASSL